MTVHFGQRLTARISELLEPDLYRRTYVIASARMEPVARAVANLLGGRTQPPNDYDTDDRADLADVRSGKLRSG